jgi:hypothetical protein
MIFERGESGDRLSANLEGRESVRDPLLGLGEDIEDHLAQPGQCGALRLLQRIEVLVNFLGRHGPIVLIEPPREQVRSLDRAASPAARWFLQGSVPAGCRAPFQVTTIRHGEVPKAPRMERPMIAGTAASRVREVTR